MPDIMSFIIFSSRLVVCYALPSANSNTTS
jgi:hypothetical protein